MLAFLAVLRVVRAAIGLFGMVNLINGCTMLGKTSNPGANDATLALGVVLMLAFAVSRWLINIPYVRITGMPGVAKFWGL
jgi:hypothetical protein